MNNGPADEPSGEKPETRPAGAPRDGSRTTKSSSRPRTNTFLYLILGGAIGVFFAERIDHFVSEGGAFAELSLFEWVALIPLTILGGLTCIVIHEIGHALMAMSAGWKFVFLAVGPLWLGRLEGRTQLRFAKLPSGFGGMALCIPKDREAMERGIARFYAGGPLASLLFALLLAGLGLACGDSAGTFLQVLVWITAFFSALLFVANAFLPGTGIATDGQRLWRWYRGDPRVRSELAMMMLNGQIYSGDRPRDWNPSLLRELDHDDSERMRTAREMLLASVEFDHGQRAEALERIERLAADWENVLPALRPNLALSLSFFLALVRGDAVQARHWLDKAHGGFVEEWRRSSGEAAIHVAEGNPSAATDALRLAREGSLKSRFPRSAADEEILDEIESSIG